MICDKCKTAISNTAKFCPKCGDRAELKQHQENQIIKCPQCGTDNSVMAKFCKVDGYNLQQAQMVRSEKRVPTEDVLVCPVCGTENSLGAKFCKNDGTLLARLEIATAETEIVQAPKMPESKPVIELPKPSLTVTCPQCGTENPASAKYCKKDGTPLEAKAPKGVATSTVTKQLAKEAKKNRDSLRPPSVVVGAQEKHSNKWIWIALIAVIVIACVAAGTFYYLGYIGMNPSRVQKIINNDLRSKGFSVSVTVDDKWVAKMEGTVNDDNDKHILLNIVKSNKYVKDVVDSTILPQGPAADEAKPADEQPAQAVEEPKPSPSQTTSISTPKPSTPSTPASPDPVRNSVNSSLKKKGLHNVYLEVKQDMKGVLKGYVYSAADKSSAMRIARAHKALKDVEDNIEVRQAPIPKTQTGTVDPAKLEGDINRAIRNAGINGVNAEVKDDMSVVLKGSVRSNDDKQRALQIVNGFRQIKNVRDLIFVVGS